MKLTIDLNGEQFKKQYIQLLAQQLPLAEVDKLKTTDVTVTVADATVTDNTAIQVIVDNIPETESSSSDD